MTDQDNTKYLRDYSERHRFWADQTVKQLSFSINLFTTLGIAFLAYIIKQRPDSAIKIDCPLAGDWPVLLFVMTLILTALSIISGFLSVISRLYDMRITRHIALTRKRAMKRHKMLLPAGSTGTSKTICDNFCQTIFEKINWIKPEDIQEEQDVIQKIKDKFNDLRTQSKLLGEFTWGAHCFQLLTFFLALIFYVIHIF